MHYPRARPGIDARRKRRTGKVATPDQAQQVHAFIRSRIAAKHAKAVADVVRILYGGSVKPDNVKGLMALLDVDGALVGGASLRADSFLKLVFYDMRNTMPRRPAPSRSR